MKLIIDDCIATLMANMQNAHTALLPNASSCFEPWNLQAVGLSSPTSPFGASTAPPSTSTSRLLKLKNLLLWPHVLPPRCHHHHRHHPRCGAVTTSPWWRLMNSRLANSCPPLVAPRPPQLAQLPSSPPPPPPPRPPCLWCVTVPVLVPVSVARQPSDVVAAMAVVDALVPLPPSVSVVVMVSSRMGVAYDSEHWMDSLWPLPHQPMVCNLAHLPHLRVLWCHLPP